MEHCLGGGPSEHDVEFGETEDESFVLVDEVDLDLVSEFFGQGGGQLEATEAGPEDKYLHPVRLTKGRGAFHQPAIGIDPARRTIMVRSPAVA